jgi:hypothetical protein
VDAYGELKLASFASARVGLFKTPLSLERWRSDPARDWVELGTVASLVTDRDTGAWVELADADQAILFGAGVFNGSTDTGSIITADVNDEKDAVAKLFIHPFRWADSVLLRDFGLGVAGSVGDHSGSALPSYKSIGQATVYSLSATAKVSGLGAGSGYRLVPQAYFYYGSLSFLGEYLRSGQGYAFKGQDYFISQEAYDLQLGWVITGEDAAFSGLKLNPNTSSPLGALQLVGRYQGVNFDDNAFTYGNAASGTGSLANNGASVSAIHSWGLGLNYVPVNNVKLLLSYEESAFADGQKNGSLVVNRETEKTAFGRAQFAY